MATATLPYWLGWLQRCIGTGVHNPTVDADCVVCNPDDTNSRSVGSVGRAFLGSSNKMLDSTQPTTMDELDA
ncbi:hypothetical protein NW760_001141 [Fusarium oxysporum]|nr:hypothetical protein NW760_001141 [Fusarium oxysporum]